MSAMKFQCPICTNLMYHEDHISAVPLCGHTFHKECLLTWLKNSTTCPSCRSTVKKTKRKGLYVFDIVEKLFFITQDTTDTPEVDTDVLRSKVTDLILQLQSEERKRKGIEDLLEEKKSEASQLAEFLDMERQSVADFKRRDKIQKKLTEGLLKENASMEAAVKELEELKHDLEKNRLYQKMKKIDEEATKTFIAQYGHGAGSAKNMAQALMLVQQQLRVMKSEKDSLKTELRGRLKDKESLMSQHEALQEECLNVKTDLRHAEEANEILQQRIKSLEVSQKSSSDRKATPVCFNRKRSCFEHDVYDDSVIEGSHSLSSVFSKATPNTRLCEAASDQNIVPFKMTSKAIQLQKRINNRENIQSESPWNQFSSFKKAKDSATFKSNSETHTFSYNGLGSTDRIINHTKGVKKISRRK